MFLSDLRTGADIFVDVERNEDIYSLVGRVQQTDESGVFILFPNLSDRQFTFIPGDKVSARAKIALKLYKWSIEDWQTKRIDNFDMVNLRTKELGVTFNRRNAYRVPTQTTVNVSSEEIESFDAVISDISLVGVALITDKSLAVEDILTFSIHDKAGDIPLTVKVVRVDKQKDGSKYYRYGTMITKSSIGLSKFIAEQQSAELKKRRLFL